MMTASDAFAPSYFTPECLSKILGIGGQGSELKSVSYEPCGNGMSSDSVRFTMNWVGGRAEQSTLVGKFTASDPISRESGVRYEIHLREVVFYQKLAAMIDARVPACVYAQLEPDTHEFAILLEDLAPARSIDQLDGCAFDDAAMVMNAAAGIHGPTWNRSEIAEWDWMKRRLALNTTLTDALPTVTPRFLELFGDRLEPEYRRIVERLPAAIRQAGADTTSPRALQHHDFRLDNMLFEPKGEAGVAAVVDWGTITYASGLSDVSYFIGSALDASQRIEHEMDLVKIYYDRLRAYPIGDYSWEHCWQDYRKFALHGLFIGVLATETVERTERGDTLFLSMVRNACDQIQRLDTLAFWL